MLRYLRDAVATRSTRTDQGSGIDPSRIVAYRGGYLPERRREIERRLREGEILCVVATNALELGIDIGELDAVVCAGYPGSVAATWQRFGRAGRRGGESICVLVASSGALDPVPLASSLSALPRRRGPGRPGQRRDPRPAHQVRSVRDPVPPRRDVRFARPGGNGRRPRLSGAPSRPPRGRGYVPLGHRCVSRERRLAPERRLGQCGHHRRRRRPIHRRARLASLAHDAPRAGHLPARRRVLAGRAARPREPQVPSCAASSPTTSRPRSRTCRSRSSRRARRGSCSAIRRHHPPCRLRARLRASPAGSPRPLGWRLAGRPAGDEVAVVEKVVGYKKIKFYTHGNAGYGDVRLPERCRCTRRRSGSRFPSV